MTARTTDTRTLLDCPACTKPIVAEIVFDVKLNPVAHPEGELPPLTQASVSATLKIAGVRVAHDCLPKVTRRSLPTGDAPIHA